LATTIEPNEFAEYYGRNWSNKQNEILTEEYNDFVRQAPMKINEADLSMNLYDVEEMKCIIKRKGNLSAFSLDKMSYPIFK
jgi:hypothetical protein